MLKSTQIRVFTFLIISYLTHITTLSAQHSISKYEYRWAMCHPFVALKIKKQLPKAMLVYQNVKKDNILDTFENGGKLDAFRHAYTMAYLSRTIKIRKLRKLGKAHEKGNKRDFLIGKLEFSERADSLNCEMDLRNNELGFLIGSQNKWLNDHELKEVVLNEIIIGKGWYIKRNKNGQYTDCFGNELITSNYKDKWHVPKCLINTNE